jgi:hypothetical protein
LCVGGRVDIYTGSSFAEEAFSLACAFSAGSLVAGFPGVE